MASSPLTLVTAAPYLKDPLVQGIVRLFVEGNPISMKVPLAFSKNVTRYDFKREKFIADAQWRNFNASADSSHSELEDVSIKMFPLTCTIDIDSAFALDSDLIAEQMQGATQGMSSKLIWTFFKGDNSTGNMPDGLEVNCQAYSQYVDFDTNGLYPLGSEADSIKFLTELSKGITKVKSPQNPQNGRKAWAMNREAVQFIDLAVLNSKYYQSTSTKDVGNETITTWKGYEIIEIPEDKDGNEILAFDETVGTSDNCASIYLMNLSSEDGVCLVTPEGTNANLDPRLEEERSGAIKKYHFELTLGIAQKRQKAAYRFRGLKRTS
jgi:hypothetical protein